MKITINDFAIETDKILTGYDLIELYDKTLLKKATLLKNGSNLIDLSTPITENNSNFNILFKNDPETIDAIRHSTAHLLAQAVKELFPDVKIGIGPTIENGFYYDFLIPTPFETSDLEKIEKRMKEIIAKNLTIKKRYISKTEALELFTQTNEILKLDLIENLDGEISTYTQGDFQDLCKGPHLPSTGFISEHFKLTSIAGSYWRGDSNSHKLQRIYGVSFISKADLKQHLTFLEEASKRDHRVLGPKLGLFHIQEEAPGSIFWHPKGYSIYLEIEQYIREKIKQDGYIEVKTPQLLSRSLWEKSGHWDKYAENMFVIKDKENFFALKPMNCPAHIQIFKKHVNSYKELPCRMSEFGCCHRNEPSGSMHGLMRVRGFVQDDAHIFCTKDQITEETIKFYSLLESVYKDFGFNEIKIKFSDRPEKRAGSDEVWDIAEESLLNAAKSANLTLEYNKGDGAFYGPKLEFVLRDAIGREWQCGTLQVDLVLAERLNATFQNQNGEKEHPVLLHRVIIGSFERFIGILIENYNGKFPMWLSPIHITVCNITNETDQYVDEIITKLKALGIRAECDISSEKISYKIRKHMENKIPIIGIVGNKEAENKQITLRYHGSKDEKTVTIDELISEIKHKISNKI